MQFFLSGIIALLLFLLAPTALARDVNPNKPADIISLSEVDPSVKVRMMYFSENNFIGKVITGYRANLCYLAKPAALALEKAQKRLLLEARKAGREYSLEVRDCYRPQKAVNEFVQWVEDPSETMKEQFYPRMDKKQLIRLGYLSSVSGHSRGGTVDLTVVEVRADGEVRELDMGTPVDFFGEESHTAFTGLKREQKNNRRLLLKVMAPEFKNYSKEWWHFALTREPYPSTAFDFDVAEHP